MNKEQRRQIAEAHYEWTQDNYRDETTYSIENSKIYDETKFGNPTINGKLPEIEVLNMTSEAAVKYLGNHCCVLNFASFTRAGGGFLTGAIAQEEALCHASNLYDVLSNFTSLYNKNYKYYMIDGCYKDWAIYSPNITFISNERSIHENVTLANVITCAAPNMAAYLNKRGHCGSAIETVKSVMKQRCKFILNIAESSNQKKLVLGAFGCGVFGNDPTFVAETFKSLLESEEYSFDKVVFAIPEKIVINNKTGNFEAFKKVFSK